MFTKYITTFDGTVIFTNFLPSYNLCFLNPYLRNNIQEVFHVVLVWNLIPAVARINSVIPVQPFKERVIGALPKMSFNNCHLDHY